MNSAPTPPRVVPTLTEVLVETDLGRDAGGPVVSASWPESPGDAVDLDACLTEQPPQVEPPNASPAIVDHGALASSVTQQVWLDLQRQVDLMLEYRMREAIAPSLARVSELLMREVGAELSVTLKDVVARAVALELARQRGRHESVHRTCRDGQSEA